MRTVLILAFLALCQLSNAQLIDPFGKITVHEIKLTKLDDGTYSGAIEWTTKNIDSLQRFVIKNLAIKAPVMVSIISKAPDHTIDLGFYKENWDKQESKVSTKGNKYATKIFRTMGNAGIGVSSKVAGIPYLITVTVGLQFPSTKSLIRITDDKDVYQKHLRKLGYNGALFTDDNNTSNMTTATQDNLKANNAGLMYVIIGLLAVIVILIFLFLMKVKSSKTTVLFLVSFSVLQGIKAQSPEPHNVPVNDMESVFVNYQTQNVANQVPVSYDEPGLRPAMDRTAHVSNDGGTTYQPVRLQPNQGSNELSGEEIEEIQRRMQEDRMQFYNDYGRNSPGKATEGDARTLSLDRTNEELAQLRKQVQQLQRQVDLLSQEDEAYDDSDDNDGAQIVLYCEDIAACASCVNIAIDKFNTHLAYWNYLQHFYLREVDDLNDKIEYGNTLASMPGYGIAWGPILTTVIRPAMNNLKKAYNKKFDEYILAMEADFEGISNCYQGPNGRFRTNQTYEIQAQAMINSLKAARINK